MPIHEPGKIKKIVRQLPHRPGVYLMKDRLGGILYVGKAKDLKKRVGSYFQPSRRNLVEQPKIRAMIGLVHDLEIVEVRSEAEALLLEGKLIKQWKPKYNTDFTDDKRFLLIRVDPGEELPRFRLVRFRKDDHSLYFGPFAHSGLLRKTLAEMRRRFGILLSDGRPANLGDGRWQLYDDVRSEIYGHPNTVTSSEYRKRVERASVFLEGKSREWLQELKAAMQQAADRQEFERAAGIRDVVFALEGTLQKTRKFRRDPRIFFPGAADDPVKELQSHLRLEGAPAVIECFDISHISGTFAVASMVRFHDGKPDKRHYRRYKIKSFLGNDDYRAMEEVVARRYMRLQREGKPFPDLVLIDGGIGQVRAALKAFLNQNLEPPALIGLAKKRETVVFTDGRPPLNLPLRSSALRLLQHLRDEAHRFANTFNAETRSRRIRETVLDDFPGLGPVRRHALLNHFKTMERLKSASPEALTEVEGIGPKFSERLYAYLRGD